MYGTYCAHCGQPVVEAPFRMKPLLREFFESMFDLEHGLLKTAKDLTVRPGYMLNRYLSGATRDYTAPFRYLIIWVTISVIILLSFDILEMTEQEFSSWSFFPETEDPEAKALQEKVNDFIGKYFNVFLILVVPLMTLVSYVLFYRRKQTFAEHLVINTYLYAHLTLLTSLVYMLAVFIPHELGTVLSITTLAGVVYYAFGYRPIFGISWLHSLIKAILINVFGFALFLIVGGVIGAIFAILVD